jgi:hypothetical protein
MVMNSSIVSILDTHTSKVASSLAETLDHDAEEARNLPGRFASIFITLDTIL